MKIPAVVSDILRTTAPTLLSALSLPPPFNVIASAVVSRTIGRYASPNRPAPAAPAAAVPVPGGAPTEEDTPVAKLTPDEVVATVEQNANDPGFLLALRQAEDDLKKYEIEAGLRFAELEFQDRKRAGELQASGNIVESVFKAGYVIVLTAVLGMLAMIVVLMLVASGYIPIMEGQMTTAAFGLIGTAVGFINGIAGTIVTFYYGSSQGSKDKTQAMEKQFERFGAAVSEMRQPSPPSPPAPPPVPQAPQILPPTEPGGPAKVILPGADGRPHFHTLGPADDAPALPEGESEPVVPASHELTAELVPDLQVPHRKFPGGATWALTAQGISVEGGAPERTGGEPKTVKRIWKDFGRYITTWAGHYGVPVELIVATIATESSGDPDAWREEPRINDRSVGLMQTLVKTAREALSNASLRANDLKDPSLSIQAGTAYIARQRKKTLFDPPIVAAAYNAGSPYREDAEGNRWRMRCYPLGTGEHIDRFVAWFGDAMRVSAEEDWGDGGNVPSFAAVFAGGGGAPGSGEGPQGGSPQGDGGGNGGPMLPAVVIPPMAGAALQLLRQFTGAAVPLKELSDRVPRLVMGIQERLGELGYLDPPADGNFGSVSRWALSEFCTRQGLSHGDRFSTEIAEALIAPGAPLTALPKPGNWIDKVVDYMDAQGHWLCHVPECRNIIYLEGVTLRDDGNVVVNEDRPNEFNDLRMILWVDGAGTLRHKAWDGSTEPSRKWTVDPMNPKGAARIKFDQFKAWKVGIHNASKASGHEALVQRKPVSVFRDLNKDFIRTGDKLYTGLFGINQHSGYDYAPLDMRGSGAGCLVGRTTEGHREFMAELKKDPRYKATGNYTFITTILPGDKVLG